MTRRSPTDDPGWAGLRDAAGHGLPVGSKVAGWRPRDRRGSTRRVQCCPVGPRDQWRFPWFSIAILRCLTNLVEVDLHRITSRDSRVSFGRLAGDQGVRPRGDDSKRVAVRVARHDDHTGLVSGAPGIEERLADKSGHTRSGTRVRTGALVDHSFILYTRPSRHDRSSRCLDRWQHLFVRDNKACVRFSVWPSPQRPWTEVLALVTGCDRAGWDGAYFADHFMPDDPGGRPTDGDVLECWAVVAALAARTEGLRLGTLVCGNRYRHPAVVANAAATVDQISAGRFVLGLGAGWQVNEHAAYGIDLLDVPSRLDHLEEACAVVTSLLSNQRSSFDGHHYRLVDAPCDPKPTAGHLPVLIGGKGELRTMRIAARFADEWNGWCTPDEFRRKRAVLRRHCEAIERDWSTIACSTQALVFLSEDETWLQTVRDQPSGRPCLVGTPQEVIEQVASYQAAGVEELIVPDWTMGSVSRAQDTLDLFWSQVAVHFR
jgi:F420-dependent oxidoreductase-like protein